ncbi:MAG: hypothetical protein HY323_11675 [Betaproteobacteria bacterium]|nr:hypothetical protein [Betaproteobacteria bacterium]
MEKLIMQVLFVVGLAAWFAWVLTRRYLNIGFDRKETGEPPTDAELRWHITNMRQDISMLAVTNFAILLVLVFALVLKL